MDKAARLDMPQIKWRNELEENYQFSPHTKKLSFLSLCTDLGGFECCKSCKRETNKVGTEFN